MCGITGIINLEPGEPIRIPVIRKMTDSLEHRGPDDSGVYTDRRIALGHRRLKILDLSVRGRQPMFDTEDRAGIIHNGEVYNFREIRKELAASEYKFRSESDTEVILNSFLENGIDCLENFIGMFAFAIYDKTSEQVFLVRDRIGIKPLYYTLFNGKLIFASEIKAILLYPGFIPEPDTTAISSYLSYRYPIGENTMFKNILSLPPGHYLKIDSARVKLHQYWDLPIYEIKEDFGEEFYIENIRELLESAVRYRMISDVPLGAYLSGGLDSSVITSIMSRKGETSVKTFTIGFEEKGYNEFEHARRVADHCHTDHRQILLGAEDYIDNMLKLIRYKDAPLGVANEPALHVMSRELKKHITVVLSGEGADEIFGGYGRIFRSPYDYIRMKNTASADMNSALRNELFKKYGGREFPSPSDHFMYLYNYINWDDKTAFLNTEIIAALNNDSDQKAIFARLFQQTADLDIYDQYMWVFEKIHIVGLLQRVDMTSMAASVEARVPFTDHRLVEFAMSIPSEYKLKWRSAEAKKQAAETISDKISEKYDIPKYILKRSYEDSLPAGIVDRKKVGFPVPVHLWFGAKFNSFAKEIMLDERAKKRNFYNINGLEKFLGRPDLFREHGSGLKVWMLLNLELWFREYFD